MDAQGVHVDPEKTRAVVRLPVPSTTTEQQGFVGMVNQPGKFIPGLLAGLNELLPQLLRNVFAEIIGIRKNDQI